MGKVTATGPGYDNIIERQTITAVIVSTDVLVQLFPLLNGEAFGSKWGNLIARWCVQFYEEFKEAPGKRIENIFREWKDKGEKDDATSDMVEKLLSILSDEYDQREEEITVEYTVKQAVEHFRRVKMKRLSEELQEGVEAGETVKTMELVRTFVLPSIGGNGGIDVCNDFNAIRSAFEYHERETTIEYPAGLGDFFGDSLREDSFICFMGSDKSGKSQYLMDMAFRAMTQRKRVVFFEAGDMSQDQVIGRFMTRVARRPMHVCQYEYPTDMDASTKVAIVTHEVRQCNERLSVKAAWGELKKLMKSRIKSEQGYLRLFNYTTGTLKVEEMRSVIQNLCRSGFKPDVVIVDYADILCPPSNKNADAREQTNAIWKQLAALRLEYHCLVATASQANAKAYGAETMTRMHFSEDKRKMSHVTGMIGINVTAVEKTLGVSRLNWIVRRDRAFNEQKCCVVAGCLAIANPAILSVF